ncbi:MAG: nucleotide exchange factor GrpE [Candidatus Nanoarchaeia archaeon]|jgi:molecular chaperone GrpE|nr:nucleotide exchange factor GrpE [Candidatus Nanoarchaeia archaeon]|tara:strand:+ start:21621 stop:22085 length:465 start_codon:yes stop_codon:yes gene_type:complete
MAKKTKKDTETKELIEKMQRLQAEFDNYKKYLDKEKQEFVRYANHELLLKLLNIADSFELALKSKEENKDFIKGIELIYAQLFSLLEKEGLIKIKTKGEKLNPELHEVMLTENGNEDNIILEEIQSGYMINDKVLRCAKVKVSKQLDGKDEHRR